MVENEKSSYEAETPKSESTNAAETHTDKQEGLITKNSQNENSESESSLLLEKIKIKESVEAQIKTELWNLESDIKNQAFFEENEGKKTIKRDIIDKFLNQLAQKSSFGEIVALKHNTLRATAVQSKLESLGYNTWAIDGIYGKNTIKAVKAFQSANGLKIDGRAGNETLNKLLSTDAKKAETSNSEQNTDTNPGTKNTIEEANDNTQKEESSTTKQSTEIVNINWKIHKVHKTNNIQDIPQDGKRTEESVYEFAGYRFFNNGRALSRRTNNTYNSDSILKKLSDKNNTIKIWETAHESITA